MGDTVRIEVDRDAIIGDLTVKNIALTAALQQTTKERDDALALVAQLEAQLATRQQKRAAERNGAKQNGAKR